MFLLWLHTFEVGVITYILLCGYPPFYGDSDAQIFDSVRVAKFDFPSPEWDDISSSAKDFVRGLLKKDPNDRPTASKAMEHQWIATNLDECSLQVPRGGLQSSLRGNQFRKFISMQKLKKAALVAIASKLNRAEIGSLEEIFKRIDQSGDGIMTLTELDNAISRGTQIKEPV